MNSLTWYQFLIKFLNSLSIKFFGANCLKILDHLIFLYRDDDKVTKQSGDKLMV